MAKISNARRLETNCQSCKKNPHQLTVGSKKVSKHANKKKYSVTSQKKDWEATPCSVCMEFPHNAVLLLCSSYNKGCRPYMCATSCRMSNCLTQYKKAYTKLTSAQSVKPLDTSEESFGCHDENKEVTQLLCPLCRGQVKGWTVVEPAREYLNKKKRPCVQDGCSFVGNYKQLRKHVRTEHPFSRPREVDPVLEKKWKVLEGERERRDVISTITATMPGAIISGDYVIETNYDDFYSDSDSDLYSDDDLVHHGRHGSRNGGVFLSRASGRVPHFVGEDYEMDLETSLYGQVARPARSIRDHVRRLLVVRRRRQLR